MCNWIHNYKRTRLNDLYTANVLQQIEEMGLETTILSGTDSEISIRDNYGEHF